MLTSSGVRNPSLPLQQRDSVRRSHYYLLTGGSFARVGVTNKHNSEKEASTMDDSGRLFCESDTPPRYRKSLVPTPELSYRDRM